MEKGKNVKNATRELCYTAVAVALLAVCAWIAVPIGSIPVTMQSLAVCLMGTLLGAKRSFFAMLAYILLGLIGVPVFAGFTGGIGKLFSPTGGYLIGFLIASPLIGALEKILGKTFFKRVLTMSIGIAVCYVFGTVWLLMLSFNSSPIGLVGALTLCVAPYVLPDVCKIFLAAFLAKKLDGKINKTVPGMR